MKSWVRNLRVSVQMLCLPLATIAPVMASADALGLRVSAGLWAQDFSGTVQDGFTRIDVQDDLRMDDENNNVFTVNIEHPVPFLPNLRVRHTALEQDASASLVRDIDFDGQLFRLDIDVASDIDLSHTDATLYYEVLDNWVSLDLGLTARAFDGEVSIRSASNFASEEIDEVVPLVYLRTAFQLPLSGLSVGAEANAIGYDDDSFVDASGFIAYQSGLGLCVEVGYRVIQLDIEESDIIADVEVDGGYVALGYHL